MAREKASIEADARQRGEKETLTRGSLKFIELTQKHLQSGP